MPERTGPSQAVPGHAGQQPEAGSSLDIHQLIADHHEAIYRYAYRLSGSATDAEDLTQQTFLVAQQKLHQVRDPERADRWLMAVLRSCYLKLRRKRMPVVASTLDLPVEQIPQQVPETGLLDRQELQAAIDGLGEDFKLVLLMFYFEQHSYKEIAAQLDIPIGTVMSRLARAKSHLRQKLIRHQHDAPPANGAARKDTAQPPVATGTPHSRARSPYR